ncbi:UvrD-helicase domain-containing protein [Actinoplanes sp. NPDC049118]|uniref:UvrD-helicase domain-containing protein n=1 Tax=Actinoplanes sp. NPDC049118 TaxID=3155769 RepID=UPI0033E00051
MTTVPAFDVCCALPAGTTVLEASAGTGKTFTIAALAARYVAEGIADLPRLMLVTFGRAATAELRERVRERLVSAERGLADPARARASDDTVLAKLADVNDAEAACRRRRLAAALADFDAATIATTHQFCQQMRAGLGLAADSDPDAVFVEDLDDLITEVVDDLYLRKYAVPGAAGPPFGRAAALTIARAAVGDSQARLAPADAESGSEAEARYRFATAVRAEVTLRKRRRRMFGYDDMLTGLAAALTDPVHGPAACHRLRERYKVVLVDEFQDTDPVQWDILRTAFHGHTTLILIGDPKQAIYAFRGADVVSYLSAAGTAGTHATLAVNWRSDQPLITALDTVYGDTALGDERITVHPVRAAQPAPRLSGAPANAPLRIRVLARDGLRLNKSGLAAVDDARTAVAADVGRDIAALLASKARIADRPLRPGDIAVLCRTNRQSVQVREALAAVDVPAVLAGTTSVFATPAARDWLALLEALEQPHRATRAAAAALTDLVGWSPQRLANATETDLDELGITLRRWAAVLAQRGVAALAETITAAGLPARLLAQRSGERRFTDLRHIGLALHTAAVDGLLGLAATVEWLRHRIDEADRDTSVERGRRLESDADAVQVITVHTSKGLEYPVVYVPFGWDRHVSDPEVPLLHDDAGARVRDVGGATGGGFAESQRRHHAEDAGEDLRLLYVALTRAQSQVVTWWAPTANTGASALHRLLIGRPAPGTAPQDRYPVPADAAALAALRDLASPHLAVEPVVPTEPTRWTPTAEPGPDLTAAVFARHLDTAWQRTSYSRLTAAAHDAPAVGSEPGHRHHDDEAMPTNAITTADQEPAELPSPMADLPSGAAFGTTVHAILENTDPTAPDLLTELTTRTHEQLRQQPGRLEPDTLAAALLPALQTPLGPLAGNRSLADIATRDRLTELDFELPLDGGDRPRSGNRITLADVGRLIGRHLDPDDPLTAYPDLLQTPALGAQRLRGYLAGSIDAVLRTQVDGETRYLVVDYKTNWLGDIGPTGPLPLTTTHYRAAALTQAMIAAHYPLQALLYAVALHRYLRWRQPDYQPDRHLGGVLYLFLRGMAGPQTPAADGVPRGVFSWRPPARLVEDLSTLLDGGPR